MDKRVLRERMRRKKRQMMIRHYTKIGLCVIGMILAVVFVVRGIIIPIAHHVAGGGSSDQTVQAQADTEEVQANSDAAVRQPLKGKSDTDKVAAMTAGWHEDANGKWYQNTDGTYFSNGFQDIDGVTYSFDENGYIQTGWVEKGVKDYYFNEDGSYDPSKVRPMLALTFDDGPGEYTDELLEKGVTAIFCMNDLMAGGVYDRLDELGLKIPQDISITGYDNRELSSYYKPPLTTITLPLHDIGYRAGEVMIGLLEKEIPEQKTEAVYQVKCQRLLRKSVRNISQGQKSSNGTSS